MKNNLFKKSMSVFLSVLMLMTCWVWIAPVEAEAADGTVNPTAWTAIHNGSGTRGDNGKIVICSDGGEGNTTVGHMKFDISSFPSVVGSATLTVNSGNHGSTTVPSYVNIFSIRSEKFRATPGTYTYNEISSVYGGNYSSPANAYTYYGISAGDSLGSIRQDQTGTHTFDITNAVNVAKANGQSELYLLFMMPQKYADNGSPAWTDIQIYPSGTTLEYTKLTYVPSNTGIPIVDINTDAANSVVDLNTNVTTIHGSFESDADYTNTSHYDAIYHNVLYTDGPVTSKASATSAQTEYGSSWTGSNGITVYWYHPTATLLYDGDTTNLPRIGVAVNTVMYYTGTWSRKTVNRLSYVASGGNGFDFTQNWHGNDGRLNFQYMWHGQGEYMGYTSTIQNDAMRQTLSGNSDNHFYANLLKFTDTMSATEYWRSAQPTFGFYGDNGDSAKTITATTTDTLYIINYIPLRTAIESAMTKLADIKAHPGKYTIDSVAKFVSAAKALVAAKPNNYINSTKNDVTGWASAAETAVNNYNNVSLEFAKYDVTFENLFSVQDWFNSQSSSAATGGTIEVNASNEIRIVTDNTNIAEYTTSYSGHNASFNNSMYSIPVEGGKQYTISFNNRFSTSGTKSSQVFLAWYAADGTVLQNSAGSDVIDNAAFTGEGAHSATFTAPANAVRVEFRFDNDCRSGGSTVYYGNIAFYPVDRATAVGIDEWTTRPVTKVYNYGQALGNSLPVPVRPGYTFTGWWLDLNLNGIKDGDEGLGDPLADGSGNVLSLQNYLIETRYNLISQWTENTYNIVFNANGGTGSTSAMNNVRYTAETALTSNGFTKAGFDFLGWSTDENATAATYTDGATVSKLSATNGDTVTLYAVWGVNKYTVTFKKADGTTTSAQYEYGTPASSITKPENTPSNNDADGHHTYSWPEIGSVTGNITYEETKNTVGHTFDQQVTTDTYKATNATCKTQATYYYSCTCGEKGTSTFAHGDLAAHTPGAAATCTAAQTCTVCGTVLAEKLPHKAGDVVVENEKAATCTATGSYDNVVYCSVCTTEMSRETITTSKLPHTNATREENRTEATCGADGSYVLVTYCSVCKTELNRENKTIPATGNHTLGNWIIDKNATCITAGSKHKECANCDYTETEAIPATGTHVYGNWAQFNNGTTHRRTCTADPLCTAYEEEAHSFNGAIRQDANSNFHDYKCEKCNAYGAGTTLNSKEACFGEGTTFTQLDGNDTQHKETCKCGREKNDSHTYGAWAADPENKADNQGKMSRICTECQYKQTTDCTYTVTETVKASCETDGHITYLCKDCGNGYSEVIRMREHNYVDNGVKTAATCSAEGVMNTICTNEETATHEACTHESTRVIPVDANAHKYGEWTQTKAPTCTAKGEAKRTCEYNEAHFETKELDTVANAHIYGEWIDENPATCVTTGTKGHYECSECGKYFDTDKNEIADLTIENNDNHVNKVDKAQQNPTCTEVGYEAGTYCNDCKTWISGHAVIPAINHKNKVYHNKIDATCVDEGTIEYWSCPDCDKNFIDENCTTEATKLTIDIDPDNHDLETTEAKTPTCTESGWDAYVTCKREGCNYTTYKEITALGHSYESVVTKPTCTEKGYTTHTCSKCGDSYVDTYVDAKGHSLGEYIIDKDATCTEAGSKHKECSVCDYETAAEEIPMLAHSYTGEIKSDGNGKDATHSFKCVNGCNEYGNATKHTWNDGEVTTSATCITGGIKTFTCTAENCGATYTEDVDADGHRFGETTAANDATCLDDGNEAYKKCTVCNLYFAEDAENDSTEGKADTSSFVISALDHDYASAFTVDNKATCDTDGSKSRHCSRCSATTDVTVIPARGHKLVDTDEAKAATCLEDGIMNQECENGATDEYEACDFTTTRVIPAKGHDTIAHEAKAPTCTETGWDAYETCSRCDYTTKVEIPALDHDFGEWEETKKATCLAAGEEKRTCKREGCGAFETREIKQLAHSYTGEYKWNNSADPKTHSQKCVNGCNEYGNETACTFDTVVTAPTCFDGGYTTYTCTVCNNSYTGDYTAMREHIYVYAPGNGTSHIVTCRYEDCSYTATENCSGGTAYCNALAVCEKCNTGWGEKDADNHASTETYIEGDYLPTCTTPGATGNTKYSCCHTVKTASEVIPAKDHTFGSWTSNNDGTHTRECTVCTDEENRIETVNCTYGEWTQTKDPTCTEKGEKERTCKDCGYIEKADVPALNHIDENNDGYCDRCGALICDHIGQETVTKDYKEATCLEDGYTGDKHCAKCDVIVEYGTKTDKLGHKDDDKNHVCDNKDCDIYQGTHEDNDKNHICDYGCKEAIGTHADSADDKDHVCDYGCGAVLEECTASNWIIETPATCEGNGSQYKECTVCGTELEREDIPAINHNYDKTKSEANLTRPSLVDGVWTQGYYTYTCKNDANHKDYEFVDRASYNDYEAAWNSLEGLLSTDLTQEAKTAIQAILTANDISENLIVTEQNIVDTAEENLKAAFEQYKGSLKAYTVTFVIDGKETKVTVISGQDATAPSNTDKAYNDTYHYSFTGWDGEFTNVTSDITVTAEFEAIEHSFTTHTDKDDTYHTDKCDCGYTKDVKHTETSAVTTKASCLAEGVRTYTCALCSGTRTEAIAKRAHELVDTTVAVEPTCSATGIMNQKCKNDATDEYEACDFTTTRVMDIVADAHKAEADYTIMQKATCDADGYKAILCEYCGTELSKVTIEKRAHVYTDNGVATKATCEADGVMNTICTNEETDTHAACTHESTRVIPKLEHSYTGGKYIWDSSTKTHKELCVNGCNGYGNETACTFDKVVTAPTCFDGGYTTYTCTVCNNSYESDFVAKRDHKYVYAPGNGTSHEVTCQYEDCDYNATENCSGGEATCTDKAVCDKCNTEYGTALGHDYASSFTVDTKATCDAVGSKSKHCSRCDAKTEVTEIPARAHNLVDTTEEKAATCLDTGIMNQKCDNEATDEYEACGYTATRVIPAKGHTFGEIVTANEATCETDGNHAYKQCTVCKLYFAENAATDAADGKSDTSSFVIPAKDHDWAETTYSFAADGKSCTAQRICKNDSSHTENATAVITSTEKIAPTCTVMGTTTYTAVFTEDWADDKTLDVQDITIDKTNHVGETYTKEENTVPGTCTTEKTWNEVTYCSDCDAKLSTVAKTGDKDATNHTSIVTDKAVESTCYSTGLTEGSHCETCGNTVVAQTVTDKKAHTPGEAVKENEVPATCYSEGSYDEVVYCSVEACKHKISSVTITVAKLNHKDENPKDAICDLCGTKLECAHPETELRGKITASCVIEGYTGDTYCKICGEKLATGKSEPTTDHRYGERPNSVINATCITERTEIYKCDNCAATKRVVQEKDKNKFDSHSIIVITKVEPTCDKSGFDVYYCTFCSTNVEVKEIEATGHIDENNDGECDRFGCGGKLSSSDGDDACTCLCHKEGWFWSIIYKIVCFFWKLFKITPSCACGNIHY